MAAPKHTRRIILLAVLLAAAAGAAFFAYKSLIVPENQYKAAISMADAGQYADAKAAFQELGSYKDAAQRLAAICYMEGEQHRADGDWLSARLSFASAGSYQDAADQIMATYYAEGESKRSGGDWKGAITAFTSAGDYSDAAAQILATYYAEGESKRSAQDWNGAAAAFSSAGSYRNAATQVLATRYDEGLAKRAAGDWGGAIEAFQKAGSYSNAETQITETRYQQASMLYRLGDFSAAYNIFESLGTYKDAASRISTEADLRNVRLRSYQTVGSYVTFGTYPQTSSGNDSTPIEWQVLEVREGKSLLISRYGLDARPYHEVRSTITWEDCSLRAWLNEEFLNTAFSPEEQSAILLAAVDNSQRQGYSGYATYGGNGTQDRIFLLSYAEAQRYFEFNSSRKCAPTDYAIRRGAWTSASEKTEGRPTGTWWLRSPGSYQNGASFISSDGSHYDHSASDSNDMVRPAFWLDLESDVIWNQQPEADQKEE